MRKTALTTPLAALSIAVALSLAAWSFFARRADDRATSARIDEMEQQIEDLRADSAASARALAEARVACNTRTALSPATARSDQSGDEADPSPSAQPADLDEDADPEAREEAARERTARLRADMERAFDSEPVDARWSADGEGQIAGALSGQPTSGSTLVEARCRSTLCRVELSHASDEAREDFLSHAGSIGPLATEGVAFQIAGDDGAPRTRIFVARAGHSLPLPSSGDRVN